MRRLCILAFILIAVNAGIISADETPTAPDLQEAARNQPRDSIQDLLPRFRGRAVVLEINTSVVEQNQTVIWNESQRKATISGRPVGIKLVGANVVVDVQFTPYLRHGAQTLLVVQSQIWMEIPDLGIRYLTSMETIPMEYSEPIYFLPLGPVKEDDSASIEVMLIMHPYEE